MDFLKCYVCKDLFNTDKKKPLILNCGHSFCQSCIQDFKAQDNQKKCPQCYEGFETPTDQLKQNFALIQMMQSLPMFQQLQQPLQQVLQQMPIIQQPMSNYICSKHKRELEFYCDQCKLYLCSTCLVTHLDHKQSLKELSEEDIITMLDKMKEHAEGAKERFQLLQAKILSFKELKIKSSEDVNAFLKDYANTLTQPVQFKPGQVFKPSAKFQDPKVDSKIIKFTDLDLIKKWIGKDFDFKLLYRGTDSEMSAPEFHKLCDNQGSTLSFFKSDNGTIFGGYTTKSWNSNSVYVEDTSAFLFNLKDKKKFELMNEQKSYAVYSSPECCCAWGAGYDLYISAFPQVDMDSKSFLGCSYKNENQEANSLVGAENFQLQEIEVYKITLK